jgi:hypothetical protein
MTEAPGRNERRAGMTFDADALAAIVSCAAAALPEGVTVEGLKAHVTFVGRPEQAKVTAEVNPFCGVTISVAVPVSPDVIVSEPGDAAKAKFGGGRLIVYLAVAMGLCL